MESRELSKLFKEYGDFYLFKDTPSSVYLEFFYVDPTKVPSKKVEDLIASLLQREDL